MSRLPSFRWTLRALGSAAALVAAGALLVADSPAPTCSSAQDLAPAPYDVSTTCGGDRAARVTISAAGSQGECDWDACWPETVVSLLSGDDFLETVRVTGTCSSEGAVAVPDGLEVTISDPVDPAVLYACHLLLASDLGEDVPCSAGASAPTCTVRVLGPP